MENWHDWGFVYKPKPTRGEGLGVRAITKIGCSLFSTSVRYRESQFL
jgi:hypothetical protein